MYNDNRDKFSDQFYGILVKQYEAYLHSKERIEDRRQRANDFFIASITAVLAFLGVGISKFYAFVLNPVIIIIIAIAGICYCFLWYKTMKSYQIKNRIKYDILQEIETNLPLNLYAKEYELFNERSKSKIFGIARIETYIPLIFLLLFVIFLAISIFSPNLLK